MSYEYSFNEICGFYLLSVVEFTLLFWGILLFSLDPPNQFIFGLTYVNVPLLTHKLRRQPFNLQCLF